MLELGDDRVFVRPLTGAEQVAVDASLHELGATSTVLLGFEVVLAACLLLWPGWLVAAITTGMLVPVALTRRRIAERRRERVGLLLEVRAERRTLRVLVGTGRLLDPHEQAMAREAEG